MKIHASKELFTKAGLKKYVNKIIRLKVKPWRIALSIALGVFIGLAIPMGLQTVIAIPLALMFQCNLFLTTTATLISNPFTVLPIYYLNFKIGESLTALTISNEKIESIVSNPTIEKLQNVGMDAVILFLSGSFIQGLIFGLISYIFSLQLIKYYRKKRHCYEA